MKFADGVMKQPIVADTKPEVAAASSSSIPRSDSFTSTDEIDDEDEDYFVEALESLDLTQPSNLKLYTGIVVSRSKNILS